TVVFFMNGCGANVSQQPREIVIDTIPPTGGPDVKPDEPASKDARKADDRRHSWNPCTERRWFETHDAHTPDKGRWLMAAHCGTDETMLRGACIVEEGFATEMISVAQLSTDKTTEGGWSCAYKNDTDEPITVAVVL